MNITTMKRKPVIAVFAFFAVLAVILGGALSPLTAQATPGDPANVETWGELEDAVDSGASPITITKNLVAEGTITVNTPVTIQSGSADGVTVYSKGGRETYDSMFKVTNYGQLTIAEGVTLSGKVSDDGTANACPGANTYTADNFTGKVSDDGTTYEPKGFFIQVEQGGSATLNGTLSDFVTSRDKETTPRYVAPVVANGAGATFNIGDTGVIKNNLVGYIVNDNKANQDAQSIKQYVKGAGPNVPRVPNATKQKANPDGFGGRTRNKDAGIDAGDAGTGITATAGAVIYKGGAQGEITGAVTNNRADTGGIMVSGEGTSVTINEGTTISKNVGVQFGGGSTVEQGGEIVMWDGEMSENVAWFGGGAVYATENGVDWLQGRMSGDDKLHPQFDDRLDGRFMMFDGKLHDNTALTRGGAILVDSDAVQITKGELTNNMSRMLGGAVYVMGDHPLYTYTMSLTYLYVHDNASVSGIQEARDEAGTGPDSATLTNKWGATWDDINANLQTRLSAPNTCVDSNAPLFSGTIDQNTDDLTDGVGTDGTGGGLWLCAYGNTIFSAGATEKVVIANNYATGTVPWDNPVYNDWRNKTGPGAKKVHADADYNSASSVATATGRTGGQDIHADTGAEGKVTIDDLTAGSGWKDENASTSSIVPYVTAESDGRINLINKGTTTMGTPQVKIVGNIARHGGGLAGDGTYVLGKPGDQVSINASMQLAKSWGLSTAKKPVVIHVDAVTESGRRATVADVPLDGVPNPATEFDSVQELVPTGNTWNGKFALPLQLTPEDGGAKIPVFTLILDYEGKFDNEEIDPMSRVGKAKLIELIEALKTIHTDVNDVVDYDAVRDDLKKAVTIEFNNGLHFECTEYDEDGNPKDTYVFTHDQVDLGKAVITLQTTDVTEKVWDETEGVWKEVPVLQSHIFGMDLKLSMTNDDQPIVEKYVNKDVHADIVNFDQDFEYDVLAYVPLSATEFTLSDTLVEGLEFADKDGNPTTDPKKAIRSITVKQVNNHQPGKGGTVSSAPVREATNSLLDYMKLGGDYLPNMSINGQDLSVIFAKDNMNLHVFENPVEPHPTRPGATIQWNRDVPGRWVQLTFGARIKDEYRSIEALKELQANVDGKTTSWEGTDTNKRGTPLRTVSYENGDMGLVSALLAEVGPDQPLWIGVEKPARAGRLFAKSVNGKYFVITKADFRAWRDGDKTKQWVLLDGSIDSYDGDSWSDLRAEAEGRYNGDIPSVRNLDATSPDLSEGDQAWVDCLADHPAIVGGTIDKAAEGGTRLFAQVTDAEKNTHIYVNEDKTGAAWTELTPADSLYDTAIKRLTPDAATVRMLDLSGATFTLDEGTKNWPVVSEEEHEGMANQAAYSVKFGNNAEGTYKTNTVTVAPETTELDVVKKWTGASEEWPEGIDTVTFGIFAVKGGEEKVVYIKDGKVVGAFAEGDTIPADATPLAVELTKDDPETDVNESEATVSGLPKLKGVRYIAREIQVNGEEVTYDDTDDTNTFGSVVTDALSVLGEMSDTFKDARFSTVAGALEEGDWAVLGAESGGKLYVKTDAGRYYVATANGDEAPAADEWAEIAKPAANEESEAYDAAEQLFAGVDVLDLTEVFTATNGKPAIEKYVDKKVHSELVEFDKEFTYDIMAYVPAGSTKVVLSDELKPQLDLVSTKAEIEASAVSKDENDHTVESSVKAQGTAVAASATVGEKTDTGTAVEVTIVNENHALDGKWVQITLKARISEDAYNAIAAKLNSENPDEAAADINWAAIEDNTPVLGGDETHSGLVNKASYKVYVGENGSGDYESNEVTVKPETTELQVAKTWKDGAGEWPEDVESVTVGLFTLKGQDEALVKGTIADDGTFTGAAVGDENASQATYELTEDNSSVMISNLPKLEGVTYFAQELTINNVDGSSVEVENGTTYGVARLGDIVKFVVTTISEALDNQGNAYSTTINNEKVEVEKYVNNDVHADLVEFDKVFKYDVMVYVPSGTTEVVINDPLVSALEFAKSTDGDLGAKAEKATTAEETVASVVAKATNDHTVNSTVAGADVDNPGEPVTPSSMNIVGNTLTVKFVDDTAEAVQGKWVQLTFYAKYTDAIIKAAAIGDTKTITDNGAVLGGVTPHEGTVNKATATFTVGNEFQFDLDTNEVTVNPETTTVTAEKKWKNADGTDAQWPKGVKEVKVNVLNGDKVVDTITLTKTAPTASKELPKLIGVTYTLDEVAVPGYITEKDGNVFTNTSVGDKQIEKYINKDVDAHLVEFDKAFTYDIMAYVPKDADEIVINDTLVNAIEFVSTDPASVKVVAKDSNNHTAGKKGTVSSTDGTAVADATVAIDKQTLSVTIADAKAYRGKWIQVTFDAQYTAETIKAAQVADSQTVTNNGAVITEIAEHDGTANTASYDVRVGNQWTRDVKSNTVTHDAETTTVTAEKKWKHADGTDAQWPKGVKEVKVNVLNGTEVVDTITLTKTTPKATSKELPKLSGVTYKLDEVAVPGYTSVVDGQVVTNTAKEYEVFFSKYEITKSDELEGAEIEVYDSEGNCVEKWTSTTEGPHVLKLEAGEYTFKEVNAPEGFNAIETIVKFTVDTEGNVTVLNAEEVTDGKVSVADINHLILEDMPKTYPVEFSKTEFDKADGKNTPELAGAEIEVYDSEGNLVDKWTSTNESHTMQLKAGEYTFKEVNAPKGFEAIETIVKFTVNDKGEVTVTNAEEVTNGRVTAVDTNHIILEDMPKAPETYKVLISKRELGENTGELAGATITVTGVGFEETWVSGDQPHVLDLAPGDYEMVEVNAPDGFKAVTTTIKFTVGEDGSVTVTNAEEVTDGKISVADTNHLILEDMPLKVTDLQVTKTWKNNAGWSVAAPEGLWPAGATVEITVKDSEGTVVGTDTLTADHRTATFSDLVEGEEYTVEEAVDGAIASSEEPKTATAGTDQVVTFANELLPHKSESAIEVLKVDDTTGEALAGAVLNITGTAKDGEAVDVTWTSGTEAKVFELKAGEYTLCEKTAPVGYLVAADITFSIDEATGVLTVDGQTAKSLVITMRDKVKPPPERTPTPTPSASETPTPTPTSPETVTPQPSSTPAPAAPASAPLVKTGAEAGYLVVLMMTLLGAGVGALIVRRRKA